MSILEEEIKQREMALCTEFNENCDLIVEQITKLKNRKIDVEEVDRSFTNLKYVIGSIAELDGLNKQ